MRFPSTIRKRVALATLLGGAGLLACEEPFSGTEDPERVPVTLELVGPEGWDGRLAIGERVHVTPVAIDEQGRRVLDAFVNIVSLTAPVTIEQGDDGFDLIGLEYGAGEIGFGIEDGYPPRFSADNVSDSVSVVYAGVAASPDAPLTFTALGDSAFLGAQVKTAAGFVPGLGFDWSADGAAVAVAPSADGGSARVRAESAGTANVIVSRADCIGVCADSVAVTVSQQPASLTVADDSVTFTSLAETRALAATAADRNGYAIAGAAPAWAPGSLADSVFVDVDAGGNAVARANHFDYLPVVATLGALSDTVFVQVWQAVASVAAEVDTARFDRFGQTQTIGVDVRDALGGAVLHAYTTEATVGDDAVASAAVQADGSVVVEAVGNGETDVVVAVDGVTDAVHVIVQQVIASVTIAPPQDTLNALGDTAALVATALDANGDPIAAAAAGIVWTSLEPSIATVDAEGRVVAQAVGSARITAAAGGKADTANVLVRQVAAEVVVAPDADTLEVGQTLALDGTVADSNGVAIPGGAIAWSSADEGVATVDGAGVVSAVAAGDVAITGTSGSVSGQAAIHVIPQVDRVEIAPASATLDAFGDTARFTATTYAVGGGTIASARPDWTVTNETVATIDADAAGGAADATAVGNGTTKLIAAYRGHADTVTVTVAQQVASVDVQPPSATIFVADTLRFTAIAADANGNAIAGAAFTWSSDATAVATVDASGLARGVAEGDATLTATSGAFSDVATVRVDPRPATEACAAGGGATHGGLIGASETWTAAAGPHHLTGDVFVSGAGVVLTVEPGALVCGDGFKLTAQNGAVLRADAGGASAIVFSASDEGSGWQGLVLSGAPADSSVLENVVVEYADTGVAARQSHTVRADSLTVRYAGRLGVELASANARFLNAVIDVSNGDGVALSGASGLENVLVRSSAGRGVVVESGAPLLIAVRIEGSGDVGLEADSLADASDVRVVGGASYGARLGLQAVGAIAATAAEQDDLLGNARDTLVVTGGRTETTTVARAALPWRISGSAEWMEPAQLQAQPAARFSLGSFATLTFYAGVSFDGSADAPIVVTAVDSTQRWSLIDVQGGHAVFRNTLIEYGAAQYSEQVLLSRGDSIRLDSVLVRRAGELELQTASFVNGLAIVDGLRGSGVDLFDNYGSGTISHDFQNVLIENAYAWGISTSNVILTIANCEITGSTYSGIDLWDTSATVTDCNLIDNTESGVAGNGSTAAVANGNWWGDVGGPSGPDGDGVSGNVTVDTWLTAPTAVTGLPQWILDELEN